MCHYRSLLPLVLVVTIIGQTHTYESFAHQASDDVTGHVTGDHLVSKTARSGIDSFTITKYVPSLENLTVNDCDAALLNGYTAQFAALRSDPVSDQKEFYGHIVSDTDINCFKDETKSTAGVSLKECLESASVAGATSFSFAMADGTCKHYSNWREHKFRQCKRGTTETMYYLQKDTPANHSPCTGVTMSLDAVYATGGASVKVTATFNNNYCCCDITEITYKYLDVSTTMSLTPDYSYTYPADATAPWMNVTEVVAFASSAEVAKTTTYIPDDDL